MEGSLTRKESKKHRRRDDTEQQLASEEGTRERKHRKKRDGKRKKKRSSVPNLDGEENSKTAGQDNKGLDHEETVSLSGQANIVEPEARIGESVDLTSQHGSQIELQERMDQSIASVNSQGSEEERVASTSGQDSQIEGTVSLHAESEEGTDFASARTGILTDSGQVDSREGSAGSDRSLRRRATLTELGKSFDAEQESSEVRY